MIYTYACPTCRHEIDRSQSIKENALVIQCEMCSQNGVDETMKRVISGAPGFVLLGQTWARDGYRSK